MALPGLPARPGQCSGELQRRHSGLRPRPREIHPSILDPEKYEYTFAPDPLFCRILEFYCPGCGTQIETEYTPPGHPPTVDMIWDIDALKKQWADRDGDPETLINYGPGENAISEPRTPHSHSHSHAQR